MSKGNTKNISDFLLDTDVQLAMDYGKSRNVFDIVALTETQHSKMLGWLLDPHEGHGQHDYFLKTLLRSAFKAQNNTDEPVENSFFKDWSALDLESNSFGGAIVKTEVSISEESGRRIDLMVIDHVNEMVVFIENKTGSAESKDQTADYYRELSDKYKEFSQLFIFMDMYETNAIDAGHWINLTYSWIEQAIKDLLNRQILHSEIEKMLKEYAQSISDYEVEDDAFYEQPEKLLSKIAKEHSDFLHQMKVVRGDEFKIKSKLENLDIDAKEKSDVLIHLYFRHQSFFDHLLDYSGFEHLVEQVQEKLGYELDLDMKKTHFFLHRDQWSECYITDIDYWGVNFEVKPDSEQSVYSIEVRIRPNSFKKPKQAEEIALKQQRTLGGRGSKNIKIVQVTGVTESDLVNKIAEYILQIQEFIKKYQNAI